MTIHTTVRATLALIAFSVLTLQSAIQAQDPSALAQSTADDLKQLHGSWSGVEVGREDRGQCKLIIEGEVIRFEGANKNEWYVGTMTLPAGKNPRELYARITDCVEPEAIGKTAVAIYKIEDGTLTLVGHPPGVPEPPKGFQADGRTRKFVLQKPEQRKDKGAGFLKAEKKPEQAKEAKLPSNTNRSVEQRFEDADIALAIAQYEKLRNASFEIHLKLQVEPPSDQFAAETLAKKEAMLREQANTLREETIRRAASPAVQR